jgi:hypothetical protein
MKFSKPTKENKYFCSSKVSGIFILQEFEKEKKKKETKNKYSKIKQTPT